MSSRGGKQPRGGKEASGYQPGRAPYQAGRGGRGGRNTNREYADNSKPQKPTQPAPSKAEQQFDKLFGAGKKPEESKKPAAKAPSKTQGPPLGGPGPQIDDAIVFEDDAIVMDDDAIIIDDENEDDRVRFTKEQLLKGFKKANEIDF
jgi:hypothetical protein